MHKSKVEDFVRDCALIDEGKDSQSSSAIREEDKNKKQALLSFSGYPKQVKQDDFDDSVVVWLFKNNKLSSFQAFDILIVIYQIIPLFYIHRITKLVPYYQSITLRLSLSESLSKRTVIPNLKWEPGRLTRRGLTFASWNSSREWKIFSRRSIFSAQLLIVGPLGEDLSWVWQPIG